MRRPKPSGGREPAPRFNPSAYYDQLAREQARGVKFRPETNRLINLYCHMRAKERVRIRAEQSAERAEARATQRRFFKLSVMRSLGYLCSCCGESLTVAQTIDHVEGGGSMERKTSVKDSWRRAATDASGLQLFCYLCNLMKADRELCPHQVIARRLFRGESVMVTFQGQVLAA